MHAKHLVSIVFLFLYILCGAQNNIYFINKTGRPVWIQKRTILEIGSFPYVLANVNAIQSIPLETDDPTILNVVIIPKSRPYGTSDGVYYLFKPHDTLIIKSNAKDQPSVSHISSMKRTAELGFILELLNKVNITPFYSLSSTNKALYNLLFNTDIPLKKRDSIIDSLSRPYINIVKNYCSTKQIDSQIGDLYRHHFEGMLYYNKLNSFSISYKYKNEINSFYKDSLSDWSDFNRTRCNNLFFYKVAANQIISIRNKDLDPKEYLFEICAIAKEDMKNFLLSRYMLDQLAMEINKREELMLVYDSLCSGAIYKEIVHNNYLLATTPLNTEDNLASLMKSDKSKVGFNDLIAKFKGKIVYIDFWASWCQPCIKEIPFSHNLQEKVKHSNIVLLYISIDTDFESWVNASSNLKVTGQNSFILVNGTNNNLSRKLAIDAIPRYILINKEGQIINKDASRPSDKKTLQMLLKF